MKINLDNRTTYHGGDLRRFLVAGINANGAGLGGTWHVRVGYSKRNGGVDSATGCAFLNSHTFRLGIARPVSGVLTPDDMRHAARVLMHELDHCRGLRHAEMVPVSMRDTSWSDGLAVCDVPAVERPKPTKADRAVAAVQRITDLIAGAERSHARHLKALRTRLAKAKRSADYHAKKAAAPAAPAKPKAPKLRGPNVLRDIMRQVREQVGREPGLEVEVGLRCDANDKPTPVGEQWPVDSDLYDTFPLAVQLRTFETRTGTWDLYVYTERGLWGNLPLVWSDDGSTANVG